MNAFPSLLAALTAAPEKIPDLKPPRGAIPATLWEQHGMTLAFLGAIVLVLVIAIVRRLRQPKPVIIPTPADIARSELDALRGCENAALVNTEAARVLRRFLIAKFGLAGPGLTADEITSHLPMDETLASNLHFFLHQCDVANFAPAAPTPAADSVIEHARELIDSIERKLPPPLPVSQAAMATSA
jgi:hypothetical protein